MKKASLLFVMFLFAVFLTGCSPKETFTSSMDSVKGFLGMETTKKDHGAAGEIDFDNLLENVEANAVSEQEMINCLNDKGVTLYAGASCDFSCADVQKHGKKTKEFNCVDCDTNSAICDMAGIKSLPMRSASGKQVKDITSLNDLANEFGCNG